MEKDIMQQVQLKDSFKIFKAAYEAVDAYSATKAKLRRVGNVFKVDGREYDLRNYDNIYVIGAGKATAHMAKAIEDMLADKNIGGKIIVKRGYTTNLSRIMQIEASHPYSDEAGVLNTHKIIGTLEKAGQNDLVIALFSGGASSLMSSPAQGILLDEKNSLIKKLFEVGANIKEINIIRKHTSAIKGGRFVKFAYPAKIISLILSDVIGDDLGTIASGPTVPDTSTYYDAIEILKKYGIYDEIPQTIREHLSNGMRGENFDAPKRGDRIYDNVQNVLVGGLKVAIERAKEEADYLGYKVYVLSESLDGDVKDAAKQFIEIVKNKEFKKIPLKKPACILAGGETTLKIRSNGKGGRNTEMALRVAEGISGEEHAQFLSASTDGTDGPTDAAGAIVTGETFRKAMQKGMDADKYLRRSDSYSFFADFEGLVKTGPTKTNVNDIQVLLIK